MIKVKVTTDNEGRWYWIPEQLLDVFNLMVDNMSKITYLDSPEIFENFEDEFGMYATDGSEEIIPDYYKNRDYIKI